MRRLLSLLFGPSQAPVKLVTALSRDECVAALRREIDSPWTFNGSRPLIGKANEQGLIAAKRIWYRNAFQTRIRATWERLPRGTAVHCAFGMPAFTTAFLLFWFATAAAAGGTMFAIAIGMLLADPAAVRNGEAFLQLLAFTVGPLVVFGAGWGIVRLGRWLARDERQFLIDFLRQTLKVEVEPPGRFGSARRRS